MNFRLIAFTSIPATAVLWACIYALPYLTLYQIKVAINAGDAQALAEHIHFASVRRGIIEQVETAIEAEMRAEYGDEDYEQSSGAFLLKVAAEQLADRYISPDGILRLMNPETVQSPDDGDAAADRESGETSDDSLFQSSFRQAEYAAHDRFVFTVADANEQNAVHFILSRSQLTWTLTRIELDL